MKRIIIPAIFYVALIAFLMSADMADGDLLYPKNAFSNPPSYAGKIHPVDFSREFDKLRNLLQEMLGGTFPFTIFKDLTSNASPELEILEESDHYIVKFHLPNAEKWNINVSVANGLLIITGNSNMSSKDDHDNQLFHHEQKMRNFQRSLTLPGPVMENAIDTKYEKDNLTITLPKRPI
jgi:HSP20 family protein